MTELDTARDRPPQLVRHYLAILWRRKGVLLVTLTVTVVAAAYYSFQQPTIYESAAEVHLRAIMLPGGDSAAEPNLTNESLLARSAPVAEHASRLLGEPAAVADLSSGLSVAPVQPGASILSFRYRAQDAEMAQRLAQISATAYLEYRREELIAQLDSAAKPLRDQAEALRTRLAELPRQLREADDPTERQLLQAETSARAEQLVALEQQTELPSPESLRVGSIIRPATLPQAPSSPNHSGDLLLALMMGAALGAGLAVLIDRLDERVRGREELESALGAPVLAAVPMLSERRNGHSPLMTLTAPDSRAAEAYRALRTALLLSKSQDPVQTLLVTSVDANQAATVTSANLAVVLALTGLRTAIVAADLSSPGRLHNLLENQPELDGQVELLDLADLLDGAERAERVARTVLTPARVSSDVSSMGEWGHFFRMAQALPLAQAEPAEAPTPGGLPPYRGDLLASEMLPKVLADLRTRAEFVVLDGPPLPAGVDATILASAVDGVLLVARAGRTDRVTLVDAERELRRVGTRVVGTVLLQ